MPRAHLPTMAVLCPKYPSSTALALTAALCLTLGINISHFTLEEFALYRPPWQQPSFPSLGSGAILLGKRPPLLLFWEQ